MPFGSLRRIERVVGDLLDGQGLVGLGAGEHAVGELDVVGIDLEHMRGDRLRLGR